RVSDITGGINYYIEQGDDDIAELLTHIQVYEASHKKRVRILNHISNARERLNISAPTEKASAGSDTSTGDDSAAVEGAEAKAEGSTENEPESKAEEVSGPTEAEGQEPDASAAADAGSEPGDASDDSEPAAN